MRLPINYGNLLIDGRYIDIHRVYNAPWDTQVLVNESLITPWDTQVQMFKGYVSSRIVYKDKHKKQQDFTLHELKFDTHKSKTGLHFARMIVRHAQIQINAVVHVSTENIFFIFWSGCKINSSCWKIYFCLLSLC